MLDSTKANEFACQYGNDVYSEVKSRLNITSIASRIVLHILAHFKFSLPFTI